MTPSASPEGSAAATGLPGLRAMFTEMEQAPEIVRPSAFWEYLNALNLDQLEQAGFGEFKRTVNQNYFSWITAAPWEDQFRVVLRAWLAHPSPAPLTARLTDWSDIEAGSDRTNPFAKARRRVGHAVFVAMLWEYVRRRDRQGVLERLAEPALGHPISIRHRGRPVTQDLCNSALEYLAITDALPDGPLGGGGILELGAGYGRLAWVFLNERPESRYIVCDIPPALDVAQQYLSALFPDRRIFRFRHFDHHHEIANELDDAQIAFLTPNQLELLAPLGVGLFVNVSSLHEMRPEQIAYYLNQVQRHCAGHFYTKQWERSVNPHDGVVITREDYPIPLAWSVVFEHQHPVQTQFFEALYRVRPTEATGLTAA